MQNIYTVKGTFYQPQWMPELNVSNLQEQYLIPRLEPTVSPAICTAAIDWKTVGSEVNLQKMILTINLLSSGFAQLISRDPDWKIEASDHQVCAQKDDKSVSLSVQELLEIQKQSPIGFTLECPIWAGATEAEAKECMNHSLKNAGWAIANKPSELALFVHLPYHPQLLKPAVQVLANQRFQGITLSGLPSEIEPIKQAIATITSLINKPVHLLGVKQDLANAIMNEYDFVTVSSSEWIDQARSGQVSGYPLSQYPSDDEVSNLALCNIANIQKSALPIFIEATFTSWFWVPWLQSLMRESSRVVN